MPPPGARGAPPARRSLQPQARALGDPTRFRIFRLVAESEQPVRVAFLTERLGINHSAVRQHLAKLCDAGLLVEDFAARSGPGRPALEYRLAPGASGTWGTSGPYETLTLLLLELVQGHDSSREVGANAGRRAVATTPVAEPLAVLEDEMARRGFEPRQVRRGSSIELVLDNCPFETAAAAAPHIVCQLHRGLAEGILDTVGDDLRVADLVAHNPSNAGCRIKLAGAASRPR